MSTFSSVTLQENMLGVNLPVVDCWQKLCAHPVSLRIIYSEITYKNTLILTSLPSIFSAIKLLFWRKNCLSLLTTSSAYRTPCMVMPLNTQRTTISHHFLHGIQVGFDPSVCFQCWDIAWIYSWCEPANWSLLAKTLLSPCENLNVTF